MAAQVDRERTAFMRERRALVLLAESFEVTLGHRRQALAREFASLGFVDEFLQRTRHEDVTHLGIMLSLAGELVQDGEASVDLFAGDAPVLDGAGEILAEAGVEEVVIVSNLETGFGKEVREILLKILIDGMKTGSR
jgi:hypothetical protein